MGLVEIFDDRQRFKQRGPIAVDQRRQCHHRIDVAEFRITLMTFHQIDLDHLGIESLEVEGNAYAVSRQ